MICETWGEGGIENMNFGICESIKNLIRKWEIIVQGRANAIQKLPSSIEFLGRSLPTVKISRLKRLEILKISTNILNQTSS